MQYVLYLINGMRSGYTVNAQFLSTGFNWAVLGCDTRAIEHYRRRQWSDFSWKSQNFSRPLYFVGSAWNWERCWGQTSRMTGPLGQQRSLTISSAIWKQCTNVTDGRTDWQTDTRRQQRLGLHITLHCKNRKNCTKKTPAVTVGQCYVSITKLSRTRFSVVMISFTATPSGSRGCLWVVAEH